MCARTHWLISIIDACNSCVCVSALSLTSPNNSKQLARTGGLIWLHEAEAPKYIYTASLNQRKAVIQREWMAEQVALEKEREKSGDKSKKLPIDVYRAAQQEHEIKTVVPRSVLKPLGLDPNEKTWDVRY